MPQTAPNGPWSVLLDELDAAVLIVGLDGVIQYVNQHVCQDLGRTLPEVLGVDYRRVFWPEFISVYDQMVAECENGRTYSGIYYWAEMSLWEQISARLIRWDSAPAILLTITNVSDITCTEYHARNIAHFDHLLKLPNGCKLEEDINLLANTETVALLYIEIKRFEDVNELYGWENGDLLLKQVRDWLLFSESRRAQLYRVNNGFAVLGRQVTIESVLERAEEIRRRFQSPWVLSAGGNNLQLYFSVNLGVVYGQYVKNEMRNLLLRTIHVAENAGGGVAVYDEEIDREEKRRLVVRDGFINCLFNDMKGFEVHYQPLVDVGSRKWIGVEALCRWTAPNGERIPPLDFIKAAEQMKLIGHLDAWVWQTAMRQCVALGLDQCRFTLDVNFSPTRKLDDPFIDELLRRLRETRFPPDKLNIEITESTKMVFDQGNLDGLRRLREYGIRLSLDDFGTGYSSMENLIKISSQALKTDKIFLEGIQDDPYRQYLLKMLVDLAHHLDMQMIAEGVETEEEFELVRGYGVDCVQGYLFSKPLTFDQLREAVSRFR